MTLDEQTLKDIREIVTSSITLQECETRLLEKHPGFLETECWGFYDGFIKYRAYTLAGVVSDSMRKHELIRLRDRYNAAYLVGERIREELDGTETAKVA